MKNKRSDYGEPPPPAPPVPQQQPIYHHPPTVPGNAMAQQIHIHSSPRPKPAGNEWILIGLLFGIIGWVLAVATDNGDGRARKAFDGCLIPYCIGGIIVAIVLIVWMLSL